MKNFELMADLAETTLSASHAEDVLEQKERYYFLKEKFAALKRYARAERDARCALLEQNQALRDEVAQLGREAAQRRRGPEPERALNERWRLESNVSLRTERTRRPERSWADTDSSGAELESLRARLLKSENESESLRKEKEKSQKDLEAVVAQMRAISGDNLLVKARLDKATQEKLLAERRLAEAQHELEAAQQRARDLRAEAELGGRRAAELQARLDETAAKVLRPADVHFAYRVRRNTYLGDEDLLMVLRCKLSREIVLQFESSDDQSFEIRFRDIKAVEKSLKAPTQIRITLKSLFNSAFEFEVADRQRVLEDIKRFWQLFLAEPERGAAPGADVLERIKGVLFDV